MANKKVRRIRKVYNRKIIRNMLKKEIGSNKIKSSWHELQKRRRKLEYERTI